MDAIVNIFCGWLLGVASMWIGAQVGRKPESPKADSTTEPVDRQWERLMMYDGSDQSMSGGDDDE